MKPGSGYFFWILALAFGLMGLIAAAQLFTKRSITGLKKGNQDAADIFTINNRFEQLVNLSFEVNTKLTTPGELPFKRQSLIDSLNILGYTASVLQELGMRQETKTGFERLNRFINTEVETGHVILQANPSKARLIADSLAGQKIADSIYNAALSIQHFLEKDMQSALESNAKASSKLSALNKTLALIAITAILILCAIIINRHLKQVQLIKELETATVAARQSALIKEQFLANMSHEIRTPLNAIKGFSRLLSLTPLSKEQSEYAGIINESSSSLMIIVNDILDISKMEANKLRLDNKLFDLGKLLVTLKGMFRKQAEDKGLVYTQQIEEDVPVHLKGDPDRLLQILINLVGNAIKFTRQGKVKVKVEAMQTQGNAAVLTFTVSDTGIGIPADKQQVIFTRFEQLQSNSTDLIHGTGLGLSIVKSLTELMGGSIAVFSEEQKGASFTVKLPFEVVTNPLPLNENSSPQNHQTAKPRFKDASILVVEDNGINQLLIQKILGDTGITVKVVDNGLSAIETLKSEKFDLIFLDIQMPVMDGYATTQKLRHDKVTIPVIAMTAFAMPGERQKCMDAGMNDYLAKPIEIEEVYRILELHLWQKKETEGLAKQMGITNLMKLTEGDNEMAHKILNEIAKGIPETIQKLKQLKSGASAETIKNNCHYMISSYSPLGTDSAIVRKITFISNAASQGESKKAAALIGELEDLLNSLLSEIANSKNRLLFM